MRMALADELKSVVRGEVLDTPEVLEKYSRDASLFKVKPVAVVRPLDTGDVETLVSWVAERKKSDPALSITPRAAGTDMSGGPLGSSLILDTAHLNRFLELGDTYAIAEPGIYFRDFDAETKKKGLEMPSYPASREIATVGGMVANNAGGEKNLKYGKTARYVEELGVVLSDAKTHTFRRLEGGALAEKLKEQGLEGDIYRGMAELLSKNQTVIQNARPHVTKNSSGYDLWNAGDGKSWMDLTKVLVGSQGTLGVFTKVRFTLVKPKPYASMLVIFLKCLDDLGVLIPAVLKHEPDSFESFDDKTFNLAFKYFPEFTAQLKTGIIKLGLSLIPEVWMAITGGIPKLVLIVEFRSDDQKDALAKARALQEDIQTHHLHEQMYIAKDEEDARKFWTIRRESFNLLRKKVRGKRTAPFIDDFVVPPSTLPDFLPKLNAILSQYDITYTIAGHVGDGNFHIIPLIDPKQPGLARLIEELEQKVYALVLAYKGSITGEHNDGLVRTPFVEKMFGSEMFALFKEVERIFDPLGIFNPGKKIGTTMADEIRKLDLPQ